MSAPALVCAALEITLNRYLRLQPEALRECGSLDGRRIALELDGPGWRFVLAPHAGGVQVLPGDAQGADVTVKGAPLALLRQAWRVAGGEGGMPEGLTVDGDTELLQRFNRILAGVGFDPEEIAASLVGDGAAHRLAQAAQGLLDWGRRSMSTLSLDTAEYLREETYDLVHKVDVDRWMSDVDAVRERADRIEARLRLLEQAA